MKKALWIAVPLLLGAAYAITFLPLDFLQPSIARSIEASLGRRVEIGGVRLTLTNGPGVALDQVTIHEDPRAGIEPFAYAETVQARLDLLALLGGHLRFSSLRFDDANLNLVKPGNGPWNFQMLLEGPAASTGEVGIQASPAVRMRAGRVNLKFGDTKSVVYFDDVDLDLTSQNATSQGRVLDLRFSGVAARTDRTVANLEHFFIRGTYETRSAQLHLKAELEPTPVDAVVRLFVPDSIPLKGALAMNAEIAGPPSRLAINGKVSLDGASHWGYKGELNLRDQQLQLENVEAADSGRGAIHLHVWDLLKVPRWETTVEHASLETFVDLARRLGAPVPGNFSASGTLEGGIALRDANGADGQFEVRDALLRFPAVVSAVQYRVKDGPRDNQRDNQKDNQDEGAESVPVQIPRAEFVIRHQALSFGPVAIHVGEPNHLGGTNLAGNGIAEITGQYPLDGSNDFDIRFTSRGLNLASLDTRMLAFAPVIQRTASALWRGSVRYHTGATTAQKDLGWTGDYEILNSRVTLDGIADPLRVQSAKVSMQGDHVAVTRINARLASIPISGEYHWSLNPKTEAAQTFRLQAGEVTLGELERLFTPTLARENGFLSNTLRLGAPEAAPVWLARRKLEGIVSVVSIASGQGSLHRLKIDNARVMWDGKLARVVLGPGPSHSSFDDAPLSGELRVDLSGPAPAYRFDGKIDSLVYKGGKLSVDGTITASGMGAKVLAAARAQGKFEGLGLVFSPTAIFQKAVGRFDWSMINATPYLAVSSLEMKNASETFSGQGTTQADGKLAIDLAPATATPEGSPRIHLTDALNGLALLNR
jgi:hypothetical protein